MSEGFVKTFMLCGVGADPEVRMTQGGQAVLNLRVAINTTFVDKDKVKQERTTWLTCVCFGPRAEALGRIVKKGDRLFIEAEPRARSYDDRDGNKRTVVEFHILDVKFAGGGKGRGAPADDGFGDPPPERGGYQRNNPPRGAAPAAPPPDDFGGGGGDGGYGDDTIPFLRIGALPETDDIPRNWI